eukprot:m.177589 g.177589  ORF g.177589 m.177589 type:complete len:175 (-) comp16574_c0_seq4:2234-2758(-)
MSRVLSTLTARVCTFSARSTTLLNSAGKRALCTAPLMGGGYPSLSLSGIRSTSSAKEASSLSSSLRQLTTTTAMAATKLEEKLKTLITGIYDGTSEADGPPLETVCLNVSKQLEDVGNDTKAVVRMYFHGPTVRCLCRVGSKVYNELYLDTSIRLTNCKAQATAQSSSNGFKCC